MAAGSRCHKAVTAKEETLQRRERRKEGCRELTSQQKETQETQSWGQHRGEGTDVVRSAVPRAQGRTHSDSPHGLSASELWLSAWTLG